MKLIAKNIIVCATIANIDEALDRLPSEPLIGSRFQKLLRAVTSALTGTRAMTAEQLAQVQMALLVGRTTVKPSKATEPIFVFYLIFVNFGIYSLIVDKILVSMT